MKRAMWMTLACMTLSGCATKYRYETLAAKNVAVTNIAPDPVAAGRAWVTVETTHTLRRVEYGRISNDGKDHRTGAGEVSSKTDELWLCFAGEAPAGPQCVRPTWNVSGQSTASPPPAAPGIPITVEPGEPGK